MFFHTNQCGLGDRDPTETGCRSSPAVPFCGRTKGPGSAAQAPRGARRRRAAVFRWKKPSRSGVRLWSPVLAGVLKTAGQGRVKIRLRDLSSGLWGGDFLSPRTRCAGTGIWGKIARRSGRAPGTCCRRSAPSPAGGGPSAPVAAAGRRCNAAGRGAPGRSRPAAGWSAAAAPRPALAAPPARSWAAAAPLAIGSPGTTWSAGGGAGAGGGREAVVPVTGEWVAAAAARSGGAGRPRPALRCPGRGTARPALGTGGEELKFVPGGCGEGRDGTWTGRSPPAAQLVGGRGARGAAGLGSIPAGLRHGAAPGAAGRRGWAPLLAGPGCVPVRLRRRVSVRCGSRRGRRCPGAPLSRRPRLREELAAGSGVGSACGRAPYLLCRARALGSLSRRCSAGAGALSAGAGCLRAPLSAAFLSGCWANGSLKSCCCCLELRFSVLAVWPV